jgi:hypothetical protein
LVLLLGSACTGEPGSSADAAGVTRQPIPEGIDPRMVEWRSDGVLIASQDSMRKTPGYVIDSVFSPEENLRRFQATVVGAPPTALSGGERSTDAVLRRYWALLSTTDTLAMTPLIVSRGEYAFLYFPESAEGPAGMPPHIGWELLLAQTGRGLTRSLAAAAREQSAPVAATVCSDVPRRAGRNTIYGPCGVVIDRAGVRDTIWIVKTLIERGGVHKLMGLQNELGG